MTTLNIHAAKTHFSKLIEEVEGGEEVVIARAGKPVARLVPMKKLKKRKLGLLAGRLIVADDFDAPLPDEVLAAFEGR